MWRTYETKLDDMYVCVCIEGKGWKTAQMAIPSGALVKDLLGDTAVHEFCNQTMK